jgi:uncharacterized protein YegP (UPF0339 family)
VKLLIYKNAATGEWRWQLKSLNGRIIGASTEGYKQRSRMLQNLFDVTRIHMPRHWATVRLPGRQLRLYVHTSAETELQRHADSLRVSA